jgi:DNA-binding transcriptional LysR family regulator
MALNFNLLRSFWHVAGAGSVSGAAQKAFVSQPALSKAIKELEGQLGVPLFERGARGVTLTASGQSLYEYAQAIFALERDAEDAVRAQKSLEGVTLRVGASTTIATYVLPPLLMQFRHKFPGVRFSLIRDNTRAIEAKLLAYELDVALVEGPPHQPSIAKTFWRDEELVLICAPSHPLASRASVTFTELKACDWLVREVGSGTREVVENALREWQLPPAHALEIGGAETLKQAVAAGLGIACVSREAASDQLALGKLKTLVVPDLTLRRPFYRLHLKGRPLSPAARAFDAFLQLNS